jgi:hypothetical protein
MNAYTPIGCTDIYYLHKMDLQSNTLPSQVRAQLQIDRIPVWFPHAKRHVLASSHPTHSFCLLDLPACGHQSITSRAQLPRDRSINLGFNVISSYSFVKLGSTMPTSTQNPPFKRLSVKELHPSFAAEIQDVDFNAIDDDVVKEIVTAVEKVTFLCFVHKTDICGI